MSSESTTRSATFPAMAVELTYPHIVRTPGEPARLERHPRTRVSMIVADYLWRGWSAEEIVRQYPYLTLAEVHAALASYFDQPDDIDAAARVVAGTARSMGITVLD